MIPLRPSSVPINRPVSLGRLDLLRLAQHVVGDAVRATVDGSPCAGVWPPRLGAEREMGEERE